MQPGRSHAPYDSLWKALPEEITLALVRTSIPAVTAPLTPWRTDLAIVTQREIDGSFLADINGVPYLIHLEYQNYLDAAIPERMHEYASLLEQQYQQQQQDKIGVLPIVIWAIAGKTPPPVYHREAFGKVLCHREYFEIHLSDLDWREVDPLLLVLAPYLHGVQRGDLEAIGVQVYETAPPAHQKVLLAAFLALSEWKYADFTAIETAILERVRQTLNDIMQDIAASTIGQTLIKQGKAEGIAEGIAKGKVDGKADGLVAAVQVMWLGRFGVIPAEVTPALYKLSEPQLRDLLAHFVNTPTEDELRAWLGV